jgi:hypothetical protein
MEKLLFFDKTNLTNSKNIQFKSYQPVKSSKIFNFRKYNYEMNSVITGQYPSIIDINNNKYLYYQIHTKEVEQTWKDGSMGIARWNNKINKFERLFLNKFKYKNQKTNIVLMEGLAMQNFVIFKDTNPNRKGKLIKAVGGYHSGPTTHRNCLRCKNKIKTHNYYSSCWPKKKTLIYDDKIQHKCYANGLYIFESDDGINWNLYNNLPVLSSLNKCKDIPNGSGPHFDTMPSIFYDNYINKYVLYLRANLKLGCRHVLYTESIDLINWSVPQLININQKFEKNHPTYGGDNYYYMGAYQYPDSKLYIAFPSFFKNKVLDPLGRNRKYFDECTLLMISNNRKDWDIKNKILKYNNGKGHMTGPHIIDFKYDDKWFYFYVEEEFYISNNNTLNLYKLRKDGFSAIINGEFTIKAKNIFYLNYRIHKNGFIKINNQKIINGDEISKKIITNSDILNFQIFKAEIFSITY